MRDGGGGLADSAGPEITNPGPGRIYPSEKSGAGGQISRSLMDKRDTPRLCRPRGERALWSYCGNWSVEEVLSGAAERVMGNLCGMNGVGSGFFGTVIKSG